jgi:hypothetical protein
MLTQRRALAQASRARGVVCAVLLIACAAVTGLTVATAAQKSPVAAQKSAQAAERAAADIVARNAAARGGLEAWRKVETMVWMGHLESARTPAPSLPFELEQKRPNKTRFEIHAMNQRTMRIFDGARGWKSHPNPSGRVDLVPYTPEEALYARDEPVIDGPLIDYDSKGSTVALAGVEQLGGRKTYHLAVRFVTGERRDIWLDADSFLEVKVNRVTYGTGGPSMVPTFYRDYKTIEGLQIPTTIQIGDGSNGTPDLMHIERVVLNVPLSDKRFAPPGERHSPVEAGGRGPSALSASPAPPSASAVSAQSVQR